MTGRAFDVVVAGAGPAGSAAALALRAHGLDVALVDDGRTCDRRMGESLSSAARFALDDLDLWESFVRANWCPSYVVRSSWAGELRERSASEGDGIPDYHLDRGRFDAWLVSRAVERGAVFVGSSRVSAAHFDEKRQRWNVTLSAPGGRKSFEASYLVDGTGRSATLSRRLGAVRSVHDRLVGISRFFRNAAWEPAVVIEATRDGWWYTAPVPGNEIVALFVTYAKNPVLRALAAGSLAASSREAPLTAARLRGAVPCGNVRGYDASPAVTRCRAGRPWLAVGDAGVAFDPISGQGLCLALRSGLDAAFTIASARSGSDDAFAAYRAGLETLFEHHLRARALLYRAERRWSESPFWSVRSSMRTT
ncbi:MAG TPA: tryptophan 7-halogenase [Polyangiaceae bacterium]